MKQYKVTGLNSRNQCEYRNAFDSIEEAEEWYNKVMSRKAVRFVILFDNKEQKTIKMQGC